MKKFTFTLIAIATMFASCSDMADFTAADSEESFDMFQNVNLIALTSNSDKDAAIIAEDAMDYVPTVKQNYDDVYKFRANNDGTLEAATSQKLIYPITDNCVNLFGVIPSSAAKNREVSTFSVQLDQTTEDARVASDLMLGTPKEGNPIFPSNEAVAMEFKHKLAQIHINLLAGEGISAQELANATVKIVNTRTSVSFDPIRGTVAAAGEANDIKVIENTKGAFISGAAIIVPQNLTCDADFITVTLANGKVLNYSPMVPVHVMSGKSYTYNVTVKAEELSVMATMGNF